PIDGLLPEPVPCDRQALLEPVPDGNAEHAFQAEQAGDALDLEDTRHDLRIAVRLEPAALAPQRLAQPKVVVDLTVEDDDVPAVGAAHRLAAVLDVHDRQAPHADADVGGDEHAFVVRSAVGKRLAHAPHPALQQSWIQLTIGKDTRNSA